MLLHLFISHLSSKPYQEILSVLPSKHIQNLASFCHLNYYHLGLRDYYCLFCIIAIASSMVLLYSIFWTQQPEWTYQSKFIRISPLEQLDQFLPSISFQMELQWFIESLQNSAFLTVSTTVLLLFAYSVPAPGLHRVPWISSQALPLNLCTD
jgi:hypothetical protein